jgi:hypothetical protein
VSIFRQRSNAGIGQKDRFPWRTTLFGRIDKMESQRPAARGSCGNLSLALLTAKVKMREKW